MARWMLNLEGGPKRVNHAAVAIGDNIYSFGGYTATEIGPQNDFIDIHVLNTFTYRWELLPTFPFDNNKKSRNSTISVLHPETPSTSQNSTTQRRRTRSLSSSSSSHPLAQIRNANPPLDDERNEQQQQIILSELYQRIPNSEPILEEDNTLIETNNNEDNDMDINDNYIVMSGNGMPSDVDNSSEDLIDLSSVYSENSDDDNDLLSSGDELDLEEEEERIFVHIDGIGDMDLPNNVDKDRLEKIKQHPEIPFKLYGHTVVSYKQFFYLWGGRSDAYGCRQTLHRYNPGMTPMYFALPLNFDTLDLDLYFKEVDFLIKIK